MTLAESRAYVHLHRQRFCLPPLKPASFLLHQSGVEVRESFHAVLDRRHAAQCFMWSMVVLKPVGGHGPHLGQRVEDIASLVRPDHIPLYALHLQRPRKFQLADPLARQASAFRPGRMSKQEGARLNAR